MPQVGGDYLARHVSMRCTWLVLNNVVVCTESVPIAAYELMLGQLLKHGPDQTIWTKLRTKLRTTRLTNQINTQIVAARTGLNISEDQ